MVEADVLKERKGTLKHLWRLFVYVFSSAKGICAIFISLTVLLSLLRPVLAFFWGRYIDLASSHLSGKTALPMVGLLAAYYAVGFICHLIERYTTPGRETIEGLDIVQMNRLQELFHSRLFEKIASLTPEYMEIPKINDLINRVFDFSKEDSSGLNREVMVMGYNVVAKVVSVLGIGATLWVIHPVLAIIVFIAPIPTIYTTYAGSKLQFKLVKDNSGLRREFGYYETLMLGPAAKEIKSLGLHGFFLEKWKRLNDEYAKREKDTQIRKAWLQVLSNSISATALAGSNVLAIVLMTQGRISLGQLGSVMVLVGALISDTSILFTSAATFISKKNEAGVFFDLMDLQEQPEAGAVISDVRFIEADGIRYRYPLTDRFVLDGVSITINEGEKVAFVGENGAGKTTFVKILSGMLPPSEGALRINGINSGDIAPSARYAATSAVFQEPARYNTFTVSDNVHLGDPNKELDESAILTALDSAGFDGPSVDTLLGKDLGGTDLSGGQWQKLAIARGWYRNRLFIILDEPTSNLDPLSEANIFKGYIDLSRDRTVIMVTHRISIASLCDRVVVFKDGRIVEDGTHDSLIGLDGEYARLHKEQAHWYDR